MKTKLTAKQFENKIGCSRLWGESTIEGCRLVLVLGLSPSEAARRIGIARQVIERAIAKLPMHTCPCCGSYVKKPVKAASQ